MELNLVAKNKASIKSVNNLILALLLILLPWSIYTYIGLKINHMEVEQKLMMPSEQESIASAISHNLYDGRLGGQYRETTQALEHDKSITNAIKSIKRWTTKPRDFAEITDATSDTLLLSYIYSLGMKIFGVNTNAVFLMFSMLVLASVIAYTLRFRDYRIIFAPIFILSLTALFFTPITIDYRVANQAFIPGYRYISILAILPVIHVLLEINDLKKLDILSAICLIIQIVLIGLCTYLKSGFYALLAIFLFVVSYALIQHRKKITKISYKKIGLILATFALFYSVYQVTAPDAYKRSHQVSDRAFWYRIWIGFGIHPAWPFDSIKEKYKNCGNNLEPTHQKGLVAWVDDWNARCVYYTYILDHPNLNPYFRHDFDAIELATRNAVFDLLLTNPKEVFSTFFYIKPRLFQHVLQDTMKYSNPPFLQRFSAFTLLIVSFLFTFLFCLYYLIRSKLNDISVLFKMLIFLLASILPMYIVAFAAPHTIMECVCCIQMLLFLCLITVVVFLLQIIRSFRIPYADNPIKQP